MKIAAGALIGLFLWSGFGFTLMSAGAAETETAPSRQTLYLGQQIYQVNCTVCHGVEGDGNGPAASMLESGRGTLERAYSSSALRHQVLYPRMMICFVP